MEQLSTTNFVTIAASTVLVAGWFVNGVIQRRHEISKERFKVRMELLKESLDFLNNIKASESQRHFELFSSAEFQASFKKVDRLLTIYGTDTEVLNWNVISNAIRDNSFITKNIIPYIDELIEALRNTTRDQLNLA